MTTSDSDDLYARDLMRAASDASHAGRLTSADGTATLDNPFCGDRITFDVALAPGGQIADLRHDTRACLLCQASASLLCQIAAGKSAADITGLGETLVAGLKAGTAEPLPGEPAFTAFASVTSHRSRFACVALPFEALAAATTAALATAR